MGLRALGLASRFEATCGGVFIDAFRAPFTVGFDPTGIPGKYPDGVNPELVVQGGTEFPFTGTSGVQRLRRPRTADGANSLKRAIAKAVETALAKKEAEHAATVAKLTVSDSVIRPSPRVV